MTAGMDGVYTVLNKKRVMRNVSPVRTGEPVVFNDVGFEDYGYKKAFHIDENAHKNVLIAGAKSYIGESFQAYCKEHYPNIECDTLDVRGEGWRKFRFKKNNGKTYDTLFQVAGIAHADAGHMFPKQQGLYYKVNTDLAIECCKKSRDEGIKQFIFMSSMIIYGGAEYIDEYTVPAPANFYGDSKWQADKGVREFASENFAVAVLRPPMVYGKGAKGNYPLLAKIAGKTPVFPDVPNKRSMLYIENLCEFLGQLVLSGQGGVFFPQNAEYSSTVEMVKKIADVKNRRVRTLQVLNPVVNIAKIVPGSIGHFVDKAFGSSYYAQKLSRYNFDYQICDLKTSIERTEHEDCPFI